MQPLDKRKISSEDSINKILLQLVQPQCYIRYCESEFVEDKEIYEYRSELLHSEFKTLPLYADKSFTIFPEMKTSTESKESATSICVYTNAEKIMQLITKRAEYKTQAVKILEDIKNLVTTADLHAQLTFYDPELNLYAYGQLLLTSAVSTCDLEVIILLIENGADINLSLSHCDSPLQTAIEMANRNVDDVNKFNKIIEVIKFLLDKGADPDKINLTNLKTSRQLDKLGLIERCLVREQAFIPSFPLAKSMLQSTLLNVIGLGGEYLRWFPPALIRLIADYSQSTLQLNRHNLWNMRIPPVADEKKGEFKIAGFNLQTSWVTDSPANLSKYPQYAWKNRVGPLVQLIKEDKPTILALSELHLKQAEDLREQLVFQGYNLVGYSSETRESIEDVAVKVSKDKDYYYSEFVGFLFNRNKVILENLTCIELEKGEKHKRILTIGYFQHVISAMRFVVFSSHFDHLSLFSRKKSAERELALIHEIEEKGMPWFSISDRNWWKKFEGQECYEQYIVKNYICDFRDDNEQGHYGPSGSYPGHLGLPSQFEPPISIGERGEQIIEAETVDIEFRSRRGIIGINSYAYTGEFSLSPPERLLPFDCQGDIRKKSFISDHYYVGGTFKFGRSSPSFFESREGISKTKSLQFCMDTAAAGLGAPSAASSSVTLSVPSSPSAPPMAGAGVSPVLTSSSAVLFTSAVAAVAASKKESKVVVQIQLGL